MNNRQEGAQHLRAPHQHTRTTRWHQRIRASSHRRGTRLVRHRECAESPRRPAGNASLRLHLRPTALHSWARDHPHITSTLRCFRSAAARLPRTPGVHQEAVLLQRLGFEQTILTPSECIDIHRVRCVPQRGRGQRQQGAVTDFISHSDNRLGAIRINSCPFSLTSKANQVGLAAWCVSALLYFCFCNLLGCGARDPLSRTHKTNHPRREFDVHLCLAPQLLPLFDLFTFSSACHFPPQCTHCMSQSLYHGHKQGPILDT